MWEIKSEAAQKSPSDQLLAQLQKYREPAAGSRLWTVKDFIYLKL